MFLLCFLSGCTCFGHCMLLGKRQFTRSNTHKRWLPKTAPFCSPHCGGGGEGECRQIGDQLKTAAISLQQESNADPPPAKQSRALTPQTAESWQPWQS